MWATRLVLSSFMGGLTLGGGTSACEGSARSERAGLYAVADGLVAIGGVSLTIALPAMTDAVVAITGSPGPCG